MTDKAKKVVVTGDITLDWIFARSRAALQPGVQWDPQYYMQSYNHFGGATLLGRLVAKVLASASLSSSVLVPEPKRPTIPGRPPYWHSYATASRFRKNSADHGPDLVWRIQEFLGLDRPSRDPTIEAENLLEADQGDADIVVVSDANQGFRKLEDLIWPQSLKTPKDGSWLLLKLSRPDFSDPQELSYVDRFNGRVIVVVTLNDLRLRETQISRSLCWERTADDIIREVSKLHILDKCKHFVIYIQAEGALLISRGEEHRGGKTARLFYDPTKTEGESQARVPGIMVGYTLCLLSALVLDMVEDEPAKEMGPGILSGLLMARDLMIGGFEAPGTMQDYSPPSALPEQLTFPVGRLSELLLRAHAGLKKQNAPRILRPFLEHGIHCDAPRGPHWTILKDRHPDETVFSLASEIVAHGRKDGEWDVPIGRFGKLVATNRGEIENLRAMRSLISEYKDSSVQRTPLSIAVFGPPGSGKSFTIEQVAASLESTQPIVERTFNLSQFSEPTQILNALHEVRDAAISGVLPLVFWDEFDATLEGIDFGWLRYFLAPMQDGKFQAGPLTHSIGRAIFVFAGGIADSMKRFQELVGKQKQAKGTDFISRLRGFVDIPTLDHAAEGSADTGVLIRRALLLRAILEKSASHLIQEDVFLDAENNPKPVNKAYVDQGVVSAFLRVHKYNYGARSMNAIVNMSMLVGRSLFERSCLPMEAQLELHVNPKAFLDLVQQEPTAARSFAANAT